jgi:CBS domain containing-hemolysin-like protein
MDSSGSAMLAFTTAVTLALVVSFVCSIFESVLLSLGHAQVEALAAEGKRSGRLLRQFKRRIDMPIAAILIVNTMSHTVGAAMAGATYATLFDPRTLWIFTAAFTVAVLLFTEIVPKTLGVTYAQRLATPVAYGIHALTIALRPLVIASERLSRALRGGASPPVTSVEEIRLLAILGRNEGIVGQRTADIIIAATRLRRLRVADVMLPRSRVTCISGTSSAEEVLEHVRESGHSRFPYSHSGDLDEITGIVLVKDLLFRLVDTGRGPIDWEQLVREPYIVPPTKTVSSLLRGFQDVRSHMALVVDEYGGFQGLVTMEDVLEELIGEIDDEGDEPAQEIHPQPDGTLHVQGTAELRRVCNYLKMDWPEDVEAVTVGGLVAELLGRVPLRGDRVTWEGCRLEVLAANKRRAELIEIRQ